MIFFAIVKINYFVRYYFLFNDVTLRSILLHNISPKIDYNFLLICWHFSSYEKGSGAQRTSGQGGEVVTW
jgi:hypothetical protein